MKKYLTGIIAAVLAISCTAFMMQKDGTKKFTEPCQDVSKKWWKINLDCDHQSLNWLGIQAGSNYTMITTQTLLDSCGGNDCICAIFACADPNNGYIHPYIRYDSYIYNALWMFYNYGTRNGALAYKDQYYE